jgi:hypothetical protein
MIKKYTDSEKDARRALQDLMDKKHYQCTYAKTKCTPADATGAWYFWSADPLGDRPGQDYSVNCCLLTMSPDFMDADFEEGFSRKHPDYWQVAR